MDYIAIAVILSVASLIAVILWIIYDWKKMRNSHTVIEEKIESLDEYQIDEIVHTVLAEEFRRENERRVIEAEKATETKTEK